MAGLAQSIGKALVKQRRKRISMEFYDRFNGTVSRGPFKGLELGDASNISQGSLGLKVLGLYEHQLVDEIMAAPFETLVNFGAADGYMSLGPLFAGQCQKSICFEITQKGRDAVRANAERNGVSDKVIIKGIADNTVADQLQAEGVDLSQTVILCDIEGAEFDIFDRAMFDRLAPAKIIIELHDRLKPEGNILRQQLIDAVPERATWRLLQQDNVSYRGIPELEVMHDNDRALVLSPGRKVEGEWLIVSYS